MRALRVVGYPRDLHRQAGGGEAGLGQEAGEHPQRDGRLEGEGQGEVRGVGGGWRPPSSAPPWTAPSPGRQKVETVLSSKFCTVFNGLQRGREATQEITSPRSADLTTCWCLVMREDCVFELNDF